MLFSEIKLLGKHKRPTKIIMKDALNPDNQSVVILKEIKEDIELNDNIFTLRYLEGGY
jgi:hypothetical protein